MINEKIYTLTKLGEVCENLKRTNKKIVQCHGCFDVLHVGHINHFEEAKKYGDILIVTITDDKYIKKGENRPVFSGLQRATYLAALSVVDYVSICDYPTAIEAIRCIKPHFFVKGSDYTKMLSCDERLAREAEEVKRLGGKVVFTMSKKESSTFYFNKLLFPYNDFSEGGCDERY